MLTSENRTRLVLSPRETRIIAACLEQAQELVDSAELLLQSGKPHFAFHFAVLALEELGRRALFQLNLMARRRDEPDVVSESKMGDHTAKLYWSFFFPFVLTHKIEESSLNQVRDLARALHNRRQEALYVDTNRVPFRRPKNTISKAEAKRIISLARAQIELEQSQSGARLGRLPQETRELVRWFLESSSDEVRRAFFSSEQSMTKLRELGNFAQWVVWLRSAYEQELESFAQMAQNDRERTQQNARGSHPRWKFRVRLAGVSHHLKQTVLNDWNARVPWAHMQVGGNKKQTELLLTLTLSDQVPLDALYLSARGLTEKLILSLNIATLGFFWWEFADHTSRFFEHLEDLDTQQPIVLSETPELKIDWHTRTLNGEDLHRVMLMVGTVPHPREAETYAAFQFYIEGLSFLATINVHRRHEAYAFQAFYECFWIAIENLSDIAVEGRTQEVFLQAMPDTFRLYTPLQDFYSKGKSLRSTPPQPVEVTLEDVAWMKRICDLFLLKWAKSQHEEMVAPTEIEKRGGVLT